MCTNLFIIITPIFFAALLAILQHLINVAVDTPQNSCGCVCLSCCDVNNASYCHAATPETPCAPYDTCQQYDTTRCGLQYSTSSQAAFCAIPSPSIWPPLYTTPSPGYLAHPWSPDAAMLMTSKNYSLYDSLQLFPPPNITPSDTAAALSFSQLGQRTVSFFNSFSVCSSQLHSLRNEGLIIAAMLHHLIF